MDTYLQSDINLPCLHTVELPRSVSMQQESSEMMPVTTTQKKTVSASDSVCSSELITIVTASNTCVRLTLNYCEML